VKLAMAVRTRNAHWRVKDIHRRHWLELGTRHGVVSAEGQPAQAVIDDLVARTPEVLAQVRALLPPGFPAEVADSIFTGVEEAATRLAA
jgi:serine/threonine-protein kinase HipA